MLISQGKKEQGTRTENVTTLNVERATDFLSPRSCSWITATPKGNKSASHDQKSYLHCDLIDEGEPDVEG